MIENFDPRTVIRVTEFTMEAAQQFHEQVTERHSSMPEEPVIIQINSHGGETSALLDMMTTIDTIRPEARIITVVTGAAMSCGADLLAHGDVRIASPTSSIMIHSLMGWGMDGKSAEDIAVEARETQELNERLAEIFIKNCEWPGGMESFKKMTSRNLYLTPKKAKKLGIVDHVGYLKVSYKLQTLLEIKKS